MKGRERETQKQQKDRIENNLRADGINIEHTR